MDCETNWEQFFDNYLEPFNVSKEKCASKDGLNCSLFYSSGLFTISCNTDNTMQRITMLDFFTEDSMLMGVFLNKSPEYFMFAQVGDGINAGEKHEIDFGMDSKKVVGLFLQIPCRDGWLEDSFYHTDQGSCPYRIVASLRGNSRKWTINIQSTVEYDFGDTLGPWLRYIIYSAPWYNARRSSITQRIQPMKNKAG